ATDSPCPSCLGKPGGRASLPLVPADTHTLLRPESPQEEDAVTGSAPCGGSAAGGRAPPARAVALRRQLSHQVLSDSTPRERDASVQSFVMIQKRSSIGFAARAVPKSASSPARFTSFARSCVQQSASRFR